MPWRKLTTGEKLLLTSVFGPGTLPYDDQEITRNDEQYGGKDNSITPGNIPNMAISIWSLDYSSSSVSDDDRWTFIHEFGHAWSWYHGGHNILGFVGTWLHMTVTLRSYDDAYYYDLSDSSNLMGYNLEQRASIIADFWYISKGYPPKYNNGSKKSLADYQPFIVQVRTSGPAEQSQGITMQQYVTGRDSDGNSRIYRPL